MSCFAGLRLCHRHGKTGGNSDPSKAKQDRKGLSPSQASNNGTPQCLPARPEVLQQPQDAHNGANKAVEVVEKRPAQLDHPISLRDTFPGLIPNDFEAGQEDERGKNHETDRRQAIGEKVKIGPPGSFSRRMCVHGLR